MDISLLPLLSVYEKEEVSAIEPLHPPITFSLVKFPLVIFLQSNPHPHNLYKTFKIKIKKINKKIKQIKLVNIFIFHLFYVFFGSLLKISIFKIESEILISLLCSISF